MASMFLILMFGEELKLWRRAPNGVTSHAVISLCLVQVVVVATMMVIVPKRRGEKGRVSEGDRGRGKVPKQSMMLGFSIGRVCYDPL